METTDYLSLDHLVSQPSLQILRFLNFENLANIFQTAKPYFNVSSFENQRENGRVRRAEYYLIFRKV